MAKKKVKKLPTTITPDAAERYRNLPTPERFARSSITVRSNIAQEDEPLRIDKLLRNGIIDEMQHLYGLQIITLWNITQRPRMKTSSFERVSGARMPDFDYINISRMSAEDQFYKTMGLMTKRNHDLICKICFEEKGAIEAGMSLKLPVNSITAYVRCAFDKLGDALAKMRRIKKELEEPPQEVGEELDRWR